MLDGGVQLNWQRDPLDVLRAWPSDQSVFMLHSARPDARWSRYTVLASPADALRFQNGQTRFSQPASPLASAVTLSHHPLSDLRRIIRADGGRSLWLGYLGYDLARHVEHLPDPPPDDRGWPDFQLERCDAWLVFDNQTQTWTAHGRYTDDRPIPVRADAKHSETPGTGPLYHAGPIDPDQPADRVKQSIRRVIDYIAAGDVFQTNLAQRFAGPFAGSPRAFYSALSKRSPAWYGAYGEFTRFDDDEPCRTLASISPELFLTCDKSGHVTTRPIKGTRPASANPDLLRDSAKDRAELAMIVDLMRNDLGRVCRYGSVKVQQARTIESHPTVHHGVATITGQLHPSRDLFALLRATLPGGSITGAPKVRAMQIIDELEPARRGPYCGAIGMIQGQSARLNIAIRTVMIEQDTRDGTGRADVWAGGGIVADSDPEQEYDEMLVKAKAMRAALEDGVLVHTPQHQPAEL